MIFETSVADRSHYYGNGYIAGTLDGIVTIAGHPAARKIYLLHFADHREPVLVAKTWSLSSGHYMFPHLDADKTYMVMARDYKREYEPVAYDYVQPATDLTVAEQNELWQSWQSSNPTA